MNAVSFHSTHSLSSLDNTVCCTTCSHGTSVKKKGGGGLWAVKAASTDMIWIPGAPNQRVWIRKWQSCVLCGVAVSIFPHMPINVLLSSTPSTEWGRHPKDKSRPRNISTYEKAVFPSSMRLFCSCVIRRPPWLTGFKPRRLSGFLRSKN